MSNDPADSAVAPPPPPLTIHEATRTTNLSGIIYSGAEIDFATAVARRAAGQDVVVRGADHDENKRLAQQIEAAVGPYVRGTPHRSAGPHALPHFQPRQRPPEGHTFYETGKRKARKRP
jgi:hypothetical protein